ncbi:MAG: peptidase S41 [Bacteroidetes bacterium GWF2_38_335]|nr:MAG: peptidase S41 [Bacteroidetes bacterium GWF2_38_335]OFY80042.1 MAG: peptidase S41 [Bacteroidetes bacterium RIFOXYA12_FULL_38_20]
MKKSLLLIALMQFFLLTGFSQSYNGNIAKFTRIINLINTYYVDSTNEDKLVESAIVEMLQELDPHSIYISKKEVDEMNEPLEGNFEGIGVQFNILKDTIVVIAPISGGPSEKVGILAGDRIVKIENEIVAGVKFTNEQVRNKLLGDKGTKVTVSIKRKGEKGLLDFTITRDKIPIYSLDAAYMVDNETGYIRLNRFAKTTMDEFNRALDSLKLMGLRNLILDLQGNGGGYLQTSSDLAEVFLKKDQMIVYTEGEKSPRIEYKATKKGAMTDGRLVILVDQGSASASEIVSGAIQDWDRGVIIGRRTFGKGLVQRPFELPDGSMIRLTIARYYTPTGRSIQKPYEEGYDEYAKDLINRYNNGELSNADSIHFPDSLKYETMVYKRYVYGGGGIMPDLFVPLDTTKYTDYFRDLIRNGAIRNYCLSYTDEHRKELKNKYPGFKDFNRDFIVTKQMLDDLIKEGEATKVKFNEDEYNKSKEDIATQIKALIARDIWDNSEFFEIINMSDDAFLKGVEVISNDNLYNKLLRRK